MGNNEKVPFYLQLWFMMLLALVGFFGILVTDYALLLWPIDIVLIFCRIRRIILQLKSKIEVYKQSCKTGQSKTIRSALPPEAASNPLTAQRTVFAEPSPKATKRTPEVAHPIKQIPPESNSGESLDLRGWRISISFGKSSSQNYLKAVTLAKSAPQYHEQEDNGHILHQAFYSSKPDEFLAFVMLYELVGSWKSSFVMINGKLIDRKIVGQLNYCYGDKCRSKKSRFCYGASYMTENPFGCHRLQISACNNPWWSFYRDVNGVLVLDKEAMKEQIDAVAEIFHLCPCFHYDIIMNELDKLPRTISRRKLENLKRNYYTLSL